MYIYTVYIQYIYCIYSIHIYIYYTHAHIPIFRITISNGQIHGKHWPQRLDDVGCWMLGETSQFRQIVLAKTI